MSYAQADFPTLQCEKHGTVRIFFTRTTCPNCEAEEEQRLEKHREKMESTRLRGRFRECTFESFKAKSKGQRAVAEACKAFATSFDREAGGGLWLIGPVGTGKSHMGAAMVQVAVFERNLRAVMMSAREIVRELRSSWRRDTSNGRTEDELIEHFGGVSLLVLDEVGVGFGSEGELTQLFDVLDLRYQLRRPTVVLSNLNLPALKDSLGDRLFDRLREGAQTLICDWPSYRKPLQGAVEA